MFPAWSGPVRHIWRTQGSAWLALAALTALGWWWLLAMGHGDGVPPWSAICSAWPALNAPLQWVGTLAMWSVMMVAMMLPTTLRAVSVFAVLLARRHPQASPLSAVGALTLGYASAWCAYSVLAATGQLALSRAALMTPVMQSASPVLSAVILWGAGLFQFSSLKQACLTQCHSPLGFFLSEWRDGPGGAYRMGWQQGVFCVGCCWALMAVMWVVGAMNLLWMLALALLVLVEKWVPRRWRWSEATGVVLIGCGTYQAWLGWVG